MNKKNLRKAGVGLLVSALAIGSASAFLSTTKTSVSTTNITVGKFQVIFENQQNTITLKDTHPMTKEWAETHLQSYSFNIANKGGVKAKYKLSAHVDEGNINPSSIKLSLYRNGQPEAYWFSIPEFNNKMAHFVLNSNTNDSYTLYAHIDEKTENEVINQSIKFHLEVNAEQIEENLITVNYIDEDNVVVKSSNTIANLGETITPVLPEGYFRVDETAIVVQQANLDGQPINIKVKKGETGPALPQDALLNVNYVDGQAWKVGAQTLSVEPDVQEVPTSRLAVPNSYRLLSTKPLSVQTENINGTPIDVPVVKDEEPPKQLEEGLGFGNYDRIENVRNGYGQSITLFIKADILKSYRYKDLTDILKSAGFNEHIQDNGSEYQATHKIYKNYSARIDTYNSGNVGTELTIVRNNSFASHRPVEDTYPLSKAIGQALGITHYDYFYPTGTNMSDPHPVMISNSIKGVSEGDSMLNAARKLYKLGFEPESGEPSKYSIVAKHQNGSKIQIYSNDKVNYKIQIDLPRDGGGPAPEYIEPNYIRTGSDVGVDYTPYEASFVGKVLQFERYNHISPEAKKYTAYSPITNFEGLEAKLKEHSRWKVSSVNKYEFKASIVENGWTKADLKVSENGSNSIVDLWLYSEEILK